jgi:quercetin dioxygenase-like cupin family protein
MRLLIRFVPLALLLGGWASHSANEPPLSQGRLRLQPQEIEALVAQQRREQPPETAETTVLFGDPRRPGLYTLRFRFPPHMTLKPHFHADTRTAVVVSGTLYFAYGERLDPTQFKALPAGSFYTEPARTPHFAQTLSEPVVEYVTGWGPTSTTYLDAGDRPAQRAR